MVKSSIFDNERRYSIPGVEESFHEHIDSFRERGFKKNQPPAWVKPNLKPEKNKPPQLVNLDLDQLRSQIKELVHMQRDS